MTSTMANVLAVLTVAATGIAHHAKAAINYVNVAVNGINTGPADYQDSSTTTVWRFGIPGGEVAGTAYMSVDSRPRSDRIFFSGSVDAQLVAVGAGYVGSSANAQYVFDLLAPETVRIDYSVNTAFGPGAFAVPKLQGPSGTIYGGSPQYSSASVELLLAPGRYEWSVLLNTGNVSGTSGGPANISSTLWVPSPSTAAAVLAGLSMVNIRRRKSLDVGGRH